MTRRSSHDPCDLTVEATKGRDLANTIESQRQAERIRFLEMQALMQGNCNGNGNGNRPVVQRT